MIPLRHDLYTLQLETNQTKAKEVNFEGSELFKELIIQIRILF